MTGEIPQTQALAEASADSLSEAISRFDQRIQSGASLDPKLPEVRRLLDPIIRGVREQRARWEAAEKASGGSVRAPGAAKKVPLLGRKSSASLADLGLD